MQIYLVPKPPIFDLEFYLSVFSYRYLAAAAFCLWLAAGLTRAAEPAPVYVTEARVAPVVEKLPLSGTITSKRSASLSPQVSGLVAQVHVDAGDRVTAGDVLVALDPVLAKLDRTRARAALDEGKAALKEARRLSEEARRLARSKNIPQTTVHARIADVEMKSAAVARLEAEYRQQAAIVRLHRVIAPFDGVVSQKRTEAGEWIATGTPVVDLVATDRLRLDVQVPQKYFHLIGEDTPVTIELDAMPEAFPGKVATTVPVNHPNARTFLARILIDDADDVLFPGMAARAVIKVRLAERALQLPRDAVVSYPDGRHTVWVVRQAGNRPIVSERQVRLARKTFRSVIVRKGLDPGNLVVVRGNETLREGQAVQILEPTTAREERISDDSPLPR
ncbi:MAG: efflux RND transporter periplasmic adaptor subunit [Methylothermaceae bacterium]|nr:efflux RND transporter periplasmic adaptor subunit [Methylothermaceae bacterium]